MDSSIKLATSEPLQAAPAALGTNTVFVRGQPSDSDAYFRLLRFETHRKAQAVLPAHRINICLRHRIPTEEYIKALLTDKGAARLGGVMVCALPWLCPYCAPHIAEVRRLEIARAIAWWRESGGKVFLSNFTRAHTRAESLGETWDGINRAYRSMKRTKPYARLVERYGLEHYIKATEVTWGAVNGFHPHVHSLQFVAGDADRESFESEQYECWRGAGEKHGFTMSRERGLVVKDTSAAVDKYVTKWGRPWTAEDELTKAHLKRGRAGHFTMFDFLRKMVETGETWPAPLFREFAAVSKGKHPLQWSPGLKRAVGLLDVSDEQAAATSLDDARLMALLDDRDWFAVRYFHQIGALHEVIRAGEPLRVRQFVDELVSRLPSDRASRVQRLRRAGQSNMGADGMSPEGY